jgi:hypothetical protein
MRLPILCGVVAVVGFSTLAYAGGSTYKPKLKYKSASGSQKEFDTPKDACLDSIEGLKGTGRKHTFVDAVAGTGGEFTMTCKLRAADDNKVWDQLNALTILPKCEDGSASKSSDNSGSLASQVCSCDPVKGCPVEDACSSNACDADKSPPGPDRSDRCRQQPARPTTQRGAAMRSAANRRETAKDTDTVAKYNDVKRQVEALQKKSKEKAHGADLKTGGFPEFDPKDLYPDGPNDVNIGKLCGFDRGDFAAANNVAGYGSTPVGADGTQYTWHHHEELGRFQLVRSDVHAKASHWGGRSIWKNAFNMTDYPKCCPAQKKPTPLHLKAKKPKK